MRLARRRRRSTGTSPPPSRYDRLERADTAVLENLHRQLERGDERLVARVDGKGELALAHDPSPRQVAVLLAGGLINWKRGREAG